jgi:hypothetical protein
MLGFFAYLKACTTRMTGENMTFKKHSIQKFCRENMRQVAASRFLVAALQQLAKLLAFLDCSTGWAAFFFAILDFT